MTKKHRLLIIGDTSTAMSGFACYKRNLLQGLYNTNKYEIAELGFAGTDNDKHKVPWKYYPTNPKQDSQEYNEFTKSIEARYGKLRWEKIILHWKPTIVISPTDPWQMLFTATSPLRKHYHLCLSPTVDSDPQKNEYLSLFYNADTLITYTEYGKRILEAAGLKVNRSIGMGIDSDVFYPIDNKEEFRKNMGIEPDAIIFGFVARNQPRKRIPELLKAFKIYLDSVDEETAKKSYLYLHTTYPDKAWHLPRNLLELNLYNKVLFTYYCEKSHRWFPSKFKDIRCVSKFGDEVSARFNHVMAGLPDEQLNEVYNLFDLYIQCATNEGFGAPMIEAGACNIPVLSIDHSSMTEVTNNIGGDLLAPIVNQEDWNVQANKAVIDIDGLAQYMVDFVYNKETKNKDYRSSVKEKYTWEKCINSWMDIIDNIPIENTWDEVPISNEQINITPGYENPSSFVEALAANSQDPWGYQVLLDMKYMNHRGFLAPDGNWFGVSENWMIQKYTQIYTLFNNVEFIRLNPEALEEEDWQK